MARSKVFVRPVLRRYVHDGCGSTTIMPKDNAEVMAHNPGAYPVLYCIDCARSFVVSEFFWDETNEQVGT
jgi:hypothetical protein